MKFYSKQSDSKSLSDDFKQTLSAAVSITTKPILSKPDAVELEDADPDILEKKREEIRKELELQMKMDSRRVAARKRKHAESSSSSSTSGSESDSTSSSSSSSSSDNRHKSRKLKNKRRDSSSSSDEYAKKLAKKKRLCQSKKEALKLHKLSKKHEIVVSRKTKKRSPSPPLAKKHRSDSSAIMLSPSGQKVMVKNLKISTSIDKHHRVREKDIERNELIQRSERERIRIREERIRSRSPKMTRTRSRSPKRERSSPVMRPSPSDKRNRSLSRRMDTEHERREKERELAREKERREALLRCQERQRERERLPKDSKNQRLLPRPAERAMALAAAQERNTDKEIGYSNRSFVERSEPFEHRRHEKDAREHDRSYEKYDGHSRREPGDYQHSSTYRRDWHEESTSKDIYERPAEHQSSSREWDHKRSETVRASDYPERKEWSESTPKWADRGKPTEKYERRSQSEYSPHASSRTYSERTEPFDPSATSSVSKPIGGIRGRWSSWRGRGRGTHNHTDFRRPHHHTEILEERGEIYRRHINPQGANCKTR